MMDWKETRNDYNNEREQNEKLKPIADEQNKEISQLNEALNNIRKQKEEALLKKQKCQQQIDGLKYATQEYEKKGRDRIEDLNRQLERAEAEQNRHIQIDQNVNQEPQAARLEIQSKQSDENGKWKVEIEFNQNYTQLEIEEQLQANKKSVELKGYAILDFTVTSEAGLIKRINQLRWSCFDYNLQMINMTKIQQLSIHTKQTSLSLFRYLENLTIKKYNLGKRNPSEICNKQQKIVLNPLSEFQLEFNELFNNDYLDSEVCLRNLFKDSNLPNPFFIQMFDIEQEKIENQGEQKVNY